ncbi:putative sphingolipid transporter spinster [Rosa sericea]
MTKNPKAAISAPKPSWFSPERLLLILCLDNLIKRGDFKLNYFQDGVLSAAFMVGLLVASPIFASLEKRLIGLGLSIWTFATAGCGSMLVGVGEASLISLAAPFIDDHAPADQRMTSGEETHLMCQLGRY